MIVLSSHIDLLINKLFKEKEFPNLGQQINTFTSMYPFLVYLNAKKITKNGKNKLLLEFPKETSLIKLKIGISAVDEQELNKP